MTAAEDWPWHRPSTTVVGSFRPQIIASPGWRNPGDGPRQHAPHSFEVTIPEASILQGFRPDYPWSGAPSSHRRQIGDAMPPTLAAAILTTLIDHPAGRIVDLFAGPGGWSEALRRHWPDHHAHEVGVEWDRHACATRAAAGHQTIRADVAAYPVDHFGPAAGLIASPPCQTLSDAGDGDGKKDLAQLIHHAHRGQLYSTPDPRTGLVLEPLRWIHALRPRWIAFEQVRAVAPVWHAYEHHLRSIGYGTWSGILNAADYGLPQTRKRAILIAHRDRQPHRPDPSHEKTPSGLFALAPWVTMATALGWPDRRTSAA